MQILQHIPVLLVLLAAISGSSAGPVYSWVDDDGITYFSDTPPTEESVSV